MKLLTPAEKVIAKSEKVVPIGSFPTASDFSRRIPTLG